MPDTETNTDDAVLVSRILAGEAELFGELVDRHQKRIFGILWRYERDHQRLEDLVQETFIKAWRSLKQFDGRAPFGNWLSRISVNVALDHLRKRKRTQTEIGWDELGPGALEWLHSDEGTGRELEAKQATELLALAMRELSPAEQLVITMQELEGCSVKEICERTGSGGVAVRVRAMRARAKLRHALERIAAQDQ